MDELCYPAEELIALYAMRWEQEIAFREIKEHLHKNTILLSHTPVTAVQEICALFMAQAMVSRARCAVGINSEDLISGILPRARLGRKDIPFINQPPLSPCKLTAGPFPEK